MKRRFSTKETRALVREIEANGYQVAQVNRGGHLKVKRDGRTIATFSASPSDHRANANNRALLRRLGILT